MRRRKPPIEHKHAAELVRLERRAFCGIALMVAAFVAFRVAIDVYSGPSIAFGLAITALVTVVICLLLVVLPEGARRLIGHVLAFSSDGSRGLLWHVLASLLG